MRVTSGVSRVRCAWCGDHSPKGTGSAAGDAKIQSAQIPISDLTVSTVLKGLDPFVGSQIACHYVPVL